MHKFILISNLVVLFSLFGCGGDDEESSYQMSGTVNDFTTQTVIEGVATIATQGLKPPPMIEVTGADYVLSEIPPASVFDILAGSPGFINTYNAATTIDNEDVENKQLFIFPSAYPTEVAAAAGVTPTDATGIVIAKVLGGDGKVLAGVSADVFELPAGVQGPFFFDADRTVDPGLAETSASGLFVLFDVPVGLFRIASAPGQDLVVSMAEVPVEVSTSTLTLADVRVTDKDEAGLPQDVSFANDVVPIFERRRCIACHVKGKGKNKNPDGGLNLANGDIYKEITNPDAPELPRIDKNDPANSKLLTYPSREDPPDSHPNVTFTGPEDRDYQLILVWIQEGALDN